VRRRRNAAARVHRIVSRRSISESQEVEEVQGPCNADPHPAADEALVWWARRCAVNLPSYYYENEGIVEGEEEAVEED
jgi:hypothetical protein